MTERLDPGTAKIYNDLADLEEREARVDARWQRIRILIDWMPYVVYVAIFAWMLLS